MLLIDLLIANRPQIYQRYRNQCVEFAFFLCIATAGRLVAMIGGAFDDTLQLTGILVIRLGCLGQCKSLSHPFTLPVLLQVWHFGLSIRCFGWVCSTFTCGVLAGPLTCVLSSTMCV